MKIKELKEKGIEELKKLLAEKRETARKLRFDIATKQVKNTRQMRNEKRDIAIRSKHLCPSLLAEELVKLERPAEIFITHLKPGDAEVTMSEIQRNLAKFNPRQLENNQLFEF